MGYDLSGESEGNVFSINNFCMRTMVQEMYESSPHEHARLWAKFADNSGKLVNTAECRVLERLASRVYSTYLHSEPQSALDREIWKAFLEFIMTEVENNGSFRIY